jgi:putative transposase
MARGRTHSPEYKAKLILEILCEERTSSQIAARENISPKLLSRWKQEFTANAYRAFSIAREERAMQKELSEKEEYEQELLAKIGQLTYERDWLKKKYSKYGGL